MGLLPRPGRAAAVGVALVGSAAVLLGAGGGSPPAVAQLGSYRVVTVVPGGGSGGREAVDAARARLFVANTGRRQLTVVNTRTDRVVARVRMLGRPVDVAVDPSSHRVYVLSGNGSVQVLGPGGLRTISVIGAPSTDPGTALAVDVAAHRVHVVGGAPDRVPSFLTVVDTRRERVLTRLRLPGVDAVAVAVDPGRQLVWVVNQRSDDVTVVDTRRLRVRASVDLRAVGGRPPAPTPAPSPTACTGAADVAQPPCGQTGSAPTSVAVDRVSHAVFVAHGASERSW